tara:strand:+ start:88 stop:381 length:294 start_codon:yes stop_codon:yes gene_type:complete
MKTLIKNFDLAIHLKKNFSAIVVSFLIGVGISSFPIIFNLIENIRSERIVQLERKIRFEKITETCKNTSSDYKKLLNLGFPNSALEKLNECIKNASI